MFWLKGAITILLFTAVVLFGYLAYEYTLHFIVMMSIYGTFCFTVLFLRSLIEVWMDKF